MARDYESTVRRLLERAEHPRTPEVEAKDCMAKAAELMMRHNIDESKLRADKGRDPEEITLMEVELPPEHGTVLYEAAWPMIRAMGGQGFYTRSKSVMTVVGTTSLLDNLNALITSLALQMVSASNAAGDKQEAKLRAEHPRMSDERIADMTDQWVWDFIRGYGEGVAEKIRIRLGDVADEAPGNALVLQTEEDRIRAAYVQMFPNMGTLRGKRMVNHDANASGRAAGRTADIGGGRVGGNATRAIGS